MTISYHYQIVEHYASLELYSNLEAYERRAENERVELTSEAWNTFFTTIDTAKEIFES